MIEMYAKWATIICFAYWLVGTLVTIGVQIWRPEPMNGRMQPVRKWRHHMVMSTVMAWLAMWCFRTMFTGVILP